MGFHSFKDAENSHHLYINTKPKPRCKSLSKFSKVLHAGDDLGDPNNIITFILFL